MKYAPLYEKTPDFINSIGTKWWKEHHVTDYAHKTNRNGVSLPHIDAWLVETTDGQRTYVLTSSRESDQGIIFTTILFESLGIHIDALKMLELYDE